MKRILLVDDEEMILSVLKKALSERGYEVTTASNGREAMEAFNSRGADLVVTDILMPEKGGLSLLMDLRKKDPGVRIIAMSGGGKDGKMDFLATAASIQGVETLRKPFPILVFLQTVEDILAR